ncbi:carbamoyl-phosphate synthase domain-containing protein [Candidatus Carsonella ruddii]|uniref:Truncated carbamoylphosphate synthase small subunit n=1 Tax=Candidatus Carsonella ruddii PC isolate NHV TaxID=1202540 RepID=J3TEP4_CARRU|nr:carbamoyl-phosphate synthase domain-containing protein [Candidatus Carsonella ruddii]AFP84292.1 truncated carbamoylphosphate synthase small subunit [Candidatus Carsonella ruddii PC isolate NHV]
MLILENGFIINCLRINKKNIFGEISFNVSNYGYIESISDPSYKGQILILTNSYLGNVGFINQDKQSNKIFLNTIISNNYTVSSNFRSNFKLFIFCKKNNIQILTNLNIRLLIFIIRSKGLQIGCTIVTNKKKIIILYIRSLIIKKIFYD